MATTQASKRPRLSLQTKTMGPGNNIRTTKISTVDPKSPTGFNTLNNVYMTAISRSTPVETTPLTAINLTHSSRFLTLNTGMMTPRVCCPETPLSAIPCSPSAQMEVSFPSMLMSHTPPLSAGVAEGPAFSLSSSQSEPGRKLAVPSPRITRRTAPANSALKTPYSRNGGLHSILRNSPLLSSPSTQAPLSPRRTPRRVQERPSRRVAYQSPLEQTITTELYTKSHIDLLAEEASPWSPTPAAEDSDMSLAFSSESSTRDGGQTPGPFEDIRRRMASLGPTTPVTESAQETSGSGSRKRSKKDKKRRWVWTISQDGDGDDYDSDSADSGAMIASRAASLEAATPRPASAVSSAPPSPPSTSSTLPFVPLLKIPTKSRPMILPNKAYLPPSPPEETCHMSIEPSTNSISGASESHIDVDMSDASSCIPSIDNSRATSPLEPGTNNTKTPKIGRGLYPRPASLPCGIGRFGSMMDIRNVRRGSQESMRPDTPLHEHPIC